MAAGTTRNIVLIALIHHHVSRSAGCQPGPLDDPLSQQGADGLLAVAHLGAGQRRDQPKSVLAC